MRCGRDIEKLPRLHPVEVPWQVSPSTPYLKLEAAEDAADGTSVTFIAHFGLDDVGDETLPQANAPQVTRNPEAFAASDDTARHPHRLVRVEFRHGIWCRMSPSFSDHEVIPEASFDWSALRCELKPGQDTQEWLNAFKDMWLDTLVCPNPRMYEVEGSKWLEETGASKDQWPEWKHYLIVGHDSYVDVIAEGWEWKKGATSSLADGA